MFPCCNACESFMICQAERSHLIDNVQYLKGSGAASAMLCRKLRRFHIHGYVEGLGQLISTAMSGDGADSYPQLCQGMGPTHIHGYVRG